MNRIERLLRGVDSFQQRHSVLGFPFGVIKKYGDDQGGKKAALLAHYGFLSLFPLLLVFLTVLGYALAKDPQLQQGVIDTLARQFPVLGPQVEDSISTIQGSGIALVVGILGTLWGGLGITQSFQDAMNDIWNVPRRQRPNFWLRLARAWPPCCWWPARWWRPPSWPSWGSPDRACSAGSTCWPGRCC